MVSKEILLYLLFEGVGVKLLKELDWTGNLLFLGVCVLALSSIIMLIVTVSFAFHWINCAL